MELDYAINSYVVEDDSSALDQLAEEISQKYSLLQIVRALGITLTQDDGHVRAKATHCLTDVVKHESNLRSNELEVLSLFFTDRLHDIPSVEAAAEGIRVLTTKEAFCYPNDSNEAFWEKLSAVDMLSADTSARYQLYILLKTLSSKPCKSLVDAFTSLSGGEKDPQNLMVNLSTSNKLLQALGNNLPEEKLSNIFDVTFCYFPIKFNPPKNAEVTVTADELRQALGQTLSYACIAKWVIPGLLSKLAAVNIGVKLDTLSTLKAVVQNLRDSDLLNDHWLTIWDGIKFEVLHGTPENETYHPAIEILSYLTAVPEFLNKVTEEIDHESLSKTALCQVCHLAVGLSTTEEIWQTLTPKVIEKCYDYPEFLNIFLVSDFAIPHADQVFQALLTSLANGKKRESISGFTRFALKPEGHDFVPLIVHTLSHESAYSSLAKLAGSHASVIQEDCLPFLLSKLPESLDALAEVCCEKSLVHTLTLRLLSRLDLTGTEEDGLSASRLLNTLLTSTGHLKSVNDFTGYDKILLPQLFGNFEKAKKAGKRVEPSITNAACILVERAARGVLLELQPQFSHAILQNLDNIHFHLILSALAPMKEYSFQKDFVKKHALVKLDHSDDMLERAANLRLLALVANKWPESFSSDSSINEFVDELQAKNLSSPTSVEVYIWLTKGLIFRSDKKGFENAKFLTENVSKNKLIAKAYGALLADDRILVKENGCTVRPLFRQRLFVSSLPILSLDGTSQDTLTALSSLLRFTPQTVVASHIASILPMLISGLNTKSAHVQETVLHTIKSSLPESAVTLKSHLGDFFGRIISLARTSLSAKVSTSALEVLIALKALLPEEVNPYRPQVLDETAAILDHKKREVRRLAAKCRQTYF